MDRQCKVGDRILRNYFFLKKLSKSSHGKREELLKNANPDELLALVEISVNLLRHNFKLTNKQKGKLIPYAAFVRKLSRCRSANTTRRTVQKGGGVVALAALLAPALIEATRYLLK